MNVTITYNGLSIVTNGPDYTITRAVAFAGVDNRVSEINLLSKDGGAVLSRKDEMRTIILEGVINGVTADGFFTKQDALLDAYNNKADGTFDVTLWDGSNKVIPAKVVQEPIIEYIGGFTTRARFQIILKAESPYWLDPTATANTLFLEQVEGFDLPVDLPFDILGGGNVDTIVINNTGGVAIFPTITITATATLTNPTITNQTTGKSVQINVSLVTGDVVVISRISTGDSVVLNGTTNYYSNLIGEVFELEEGVNILRFSASTFDANSTAVISYQFGYRSF